MIRRGISISILKLNCYMEVLTLSGMLLRTLIGLFTWPKELTGARATYSLICIKQKCDVYVGIIMIKPCTVNLDINIDCLNYQNDSIPRDACVPCKTLCVATKRSLTTKKAHTDRCRSDPYVPLCFTGNKIMVK